MKKLLQTQQRFEEEAVKDCGKSGESWHPKTVPELVASGNVGFSCLQMLTPARVDSSDVVEN